MENKKALHSESQGIRRRDFLGIGLSAGLVTLAGTAGNVFADEIKKDDVRKNKEGFKMAEWKMDGKPGLVIMHMQSTILGEDSKKLTLHNRPVVDESGMIPRLRELLEAFRKKNLPIVFVHAIMGMGGIQHRLPAYGKLFDLIRQNITTLDDLEAARKVLPELGRRPDEPVLTNWLLGAFSYSGLDTVLKVNSVKTVVLTGFATHSAVFNAVIQAVDLWYSAIVPRDACATPATDLTDRMLKEVFPSYCLVTTTKDVIAHL